jgi:hypothetical protein
MDDKLLSEKFDDHGNAIREQLKGAAATCPAPVEPPQEPAGYELDRDGKIFAQFEPEQRLRGSIGIPLPQSAAFLPVITLP